MKIPVIRKECVKPMLETKFLNVYDLQYEEGRHYYNATRRKSEDLASIRTDEEFHSMLPDAVSCTVILLVENEPPRLLLVREYRYPAGRVLLGVPAGLLDPADKAQDNPILAAARREIHEETGIIAEEGDTLEIINPLLFSSPGMTDESNALVLAVIHLKDLSALNQDGAEGQELFAGFEIPDIDEARRILKGGRDSRGYFYSMYTWASLMYFVNDMWK